MFQEIGVTEQRQEILDWYHLKENFYKAGGSLKRLKQAESLLWSGQVNEVINLFKELKRKGFKTGVAGLRYDRDWSRVTKKHQPRIKVNGMPWM